MSAVVASNNQGGGGLRGLLGRTELWMAGASIALVVMLILPLPTAVIDLLLVFNLALSLSVLLATTYLQDPLELSSFPSLLLFMALYRLALSISVMRAILGGADAGSVVASFGNLVLAGNYIIGFVLFLTLLIVQFVVVIGGTSRIADVVARFTLDAMPGKQMAIDADLNAGMITEEVARQRRKKVSAESDFYGAMDGASKFVKGDGLASLMTTAINLLGGILVGVVQHGLDVRTSLETYALLTVGQGLVIQIPGLLMSAASGLIVTRAASEENLSHDLVKQLTARPDTLKAAAMGCFLLGVVPGLPKLPLLALGLALMLAARYALQLQAEPEAEATPEAEASPDQAGDMRQHLPLDTLCLEVGYGLVPLALKSEGGLLLERITGLRKAVAQELGLVVPPIRVRDNLTINANGYLLKLRGVVIAEGQILPRFFLALNGGGVRKPLDGEHVADPTFGLPATWVSPDQRGEAERRGYIVIDAASVCITHLGEAVRQHAAALLTRQELAELIEVVKAENPAVVNDLVPEVVSKATLQAVLQNLLEERVPIRDLVTILEALGEASLRTNNLDEMTEHVRCKLARVVLGPLLAAGELPALQLDPMLERRLADGIGETAFGAQLQIPPDLLREFVNTLSDRLEQAAAEGYQPVLACSRRLRLPLRRMMKKLLSRLIVVSYDEVAETAARLKQIGTVTVSSV
ncbi:MAG: FHIPEP family type III secretion protein [Fimbriimonadaceae bacterium]|nr:FHIPEP family type III secretion protein [Fimbriimonadaceae bacterium]